MYEDITKIIHEFNYKTYTIIIVERQHDFLSFYVFDEEGRQFGSMHSFGYSDITKEDLANVDIATEKIKAGIDYNISFKEKCAKEKSEKKKEMNWTGREFKRGDFVHFKGNDEYKPTDTYVWTFFGHLSMAYYLIEHEQGVDRINFINKPPYRSFGIGADGFEAIHSSQLQEGLKYLEIHCTEFQWETDELVMIREAKEGDEPKPKTE